MTSKPSSGSHDPQQDLVRVREYASKKIQGGEEPPWAWYQYMKLVETVDAILAGMSATTTESSLRLVQRQGKLIQLGAAKCSQDTSQPHHVAELVQMPM